MHAYIHTHTCLAVNLQSIIYPPEKNLIGTSSILARGKSRELATDPLFTQKNSYTNQITHTLLPSRLKSEMVGP